MQHLIFVIGNPIKWVIEPCWVELVKSIVVTGALLRSFPRKASPTRGISIRILQWLDGAKTLPNYPLGTASNLTIFAKKTNLTATLSKGLNIWSPENLITMIPWNTNWKGRLSTVDLLIKVACLATLVNDIFNIEMSWSKLVSARRSTVLSLPLQKVSEVPVKRNAYVAQQSQTEHTWELILLLGT